MIYYYLNYQSFSAILLDRCFHSHTMRWRWITEIHEDTVARSSNDSIADTTRRKKSARKHNLLTAFLFGFVHACLSLIDNYRVGQSRCYYHGMYITANTEAITIIVSMCHFLYRCKVSNLTLSDLFTFAVYVIS